MKIGIIIFTNDRDTCFMAIRYAGFHLSENKDVSIYFVDSGLQYDKDDDNRVPLKIAHFIENT